MSDSVTTMADDPEVKATAAAKTSEDAMHANEVFQSKLDDLNGKIDKINPLDEVVLRKSHEAMMKYIQENQPDWMKSLNETAKQANDNFDGLKDDFEDLKRRVFRVPAATGVEELKNHPDIRAYNEQFSMYLRRQTPSGAQGYGSIDTEIVSKAMDARVEALAPYLPDHQKEMLKKELIAGNDPQGGYEVFPEMSDTRITRTFETSPMRSVATVETTSRESVEYIIDDDEADSGGWVGETQARGETDTPERGMLVIHTHEQFAQPKATQKVIDDSARDIEAWLQQKVNDKFTRVENTAFVTGDGSQKPKGFLSYDPWTTNTSPGVKGVYERGKLERVDVGAAGTFTDDGLTLIQIALKETYQANAVWMLQRTSLYDLRVLKDVDGRALLGFDTFRDGYPLVLLGKPVVLADDMPAVANNATPIAYGDFRVGYTIVDRIGIRVLVDPFTEKGRIKYYTTKRVGADVTNYEAIKIGRTPA